MLSKCPVLTGQGLLSAPRGGGEGQDGGVEVLVTVSIQWASDAGRGKMEREMHLVPSVSMAATAAIPPAQILSHTAFSGEIVKCCRQAPECCCLPWASHCEQLCFPVDSLQGGR